MPTIGLFYEYNVTELGHKSADESPARTPRELMKYHCAGHHRRPPVTLTLLGVPAVGCLINHGKSAEVRIGALYSDESTTPDVPDHVLIVSLTTTRDRLDDDLHIFATIVSGIRVCTPDWVKVANGPPACPKSPGWR